MKGAVPARRRAIPARKYTTLSVIDGTFEVIDAETGHTLARGFDTRRQANGFAWKLTRDQPSDGRTGAIQTA
jgi:hypothetical protein